MSEQELIDGDVRVAFVDLNEGVSGDFNENDPNDVSLLRLDVQVRANPAGEFEDVDSASYCTSVPTDTPSDEQDRLLRFAMACVGDQVRQEKSIKRVCQCLSWMEPAWLESGVPKNTQEEIALYRGSPCPSL